MNFEEQSPNVEKDSVKDCLVPAGQDTTAGTEYHTLVLNDELIVLGKYDVIKIEDTNVKEVTNQGTVNNVVIEARSFPKWPLLSCAPFTCNIYTKFFFLIAKY